VEQCASFTIRNRDIKEFAMDHCSITTSDASNNWPDGTISAKLTMNPYLLAMAFEKAMQSHMRLWEFINVAIWEKLGSPESDTLMEFAANMEIEEDDPKWKKRLKIAARHEFELREALKKR
jgi:hypothetical protein